MRLRIYLVSFSFLVVGLALTVFLVQTRSALRTGFDDLETAQLSTVVRTLETAVQTRKTELISLSRILRADSDLSSAYILSKESRDQTLIEGKLKEIRERVSVSVVDILSLEGVSELTEGLQISPEQVQELLNSQKEQVRLFDLNGHPFLSCMAAMQLYENNVGVLVVGAYLDGATHAEWTDLTKAKIDMSWEKPQPKPHSEIIQVLPGDSETPLWTLIEITDNKGSQVAANLSFKLLVAIALCLGGLLLLNYVLLHVGFLSGFGEIVRKANAYASQLEHGKLTPLKLGKFTIQENQDLSKVLLKLSESLTAYSEMIEEKSKTEAESRRQKAMAELASQVAHDIRSPLTALQMLASGAVNLPEEERTLIRRATSRIGDISNNLLRQYRKVEEYNPEAQTAEPSPQLIAGLVESIISEKREQWRMFPGIELRWDPKSAYGHFVLVEPVEFMRVLSNLLDNSFESLQGEGEISIRVEPLQGKVLMRITDTGCGIPEEVLGKIGKRGQSFGKQDGSGLGLYHAKTTVERWNGTLLIHSRVGEGTTVSIALAQCHAPGWFTEKIPLSKRKTIVVMDDEESVHQLWTRRFEHALGEEFKNFHLVHLFSPDELKAWHAKSKLTREEVLYLADYEIKGAKETGLDMIKALSIEDRSVLVTGRFEENEIRERCIAGGVKMLPKSMAAFVPISPC